MASTQLSQGSNQVVGFGEVTFAPADRSAVEKNSILSHCHQWSVSGLGVSKFLVSYSKDYNEGAHRFAKLIRKLFKVLEKIHHKDRQRAARV